VQSAGDRDGRQQSTRRGVTGAKGVVHADDEGERGRERGLNQTQELTDRQTDMQIERKAGLTSPGPGRERGRWLREGDDWGITAWPQNHRLQPSRTLWREAEDGYPVASASRTYSGCTGSTCTRASPAGGPNGRGGCILRGGTVGSAWGRRRSLDRWSGLGSGRRLGRWGRRSRSTRGQVKSEGHPGESRRV